MPTHSTALDYVRVEVAFSSDPNTATPAFVDLTSRARLDRGIDITRGRSDEFDAVQAGRCSLTFDNTDGALTPGLASSPYYPDVKPQNRIRVTYRDPAVAGNLLSAENASFVAGTTGDWGVGYFGAPALVAIAAEGPVGARSMKVTFPTAASGCGAQLAVEGLVIGRTYTAQCRAWTPSGGPQVRFGDPFGLTPNVNTTTTMAWEHLTITWTATYAAVYLVLRSTGATTGGQYVWADSFMVDEGLTAATFTTTAAPIVYRFDGYIDEWPLEWPGGGDSEATSTVTALDLQSRVGRMRTFGSVIAETYALNAPLWHFPLSEAAGSTSAGDIRGTDGTLKVAQYGTGGELTFASGTGPATDGTGAPMFAPVDSNNGIYLSGATVARPNLATGQTLAATFQSSAAGVAQAIVQWNDSWSYTIHLGTNSSGQAVATFTDPWWPANNRTVTSASIYADGRTHHIAVTIQNTAGTHTMRLYVDGVERGSAGTWSAGGAFTYAFNLLRVGGA